MEVSSEAWACRRGQRADPRDRGYEVGRDGHAGASMCFEPTVHYVFSTRDDGDRADRANTSTPVGAVGPHEYGGHYLYPSWSSKVGTFEHSEHVIHDDWHTGAQSDQSRRVQSVL